MKTLSFDRSRFTVGGEPAFMVSGEFHYFRVPKSDWRDRMLRFIEAGGNTLATYVPWLIHEPTEGDIRFGDVDYRDFCGFCELAKELGLNLIVRPGPYQYSELKNGGIPTWLVENYPEILAQDVNGNAFCKTSVSYLHPLFLEKARVYYRAFADAARPYLAENGGPISVVQLDNELTGIHVWFGGFDYNRTSCGFGREDGRYPRFLRAKYGDVAAMNAAYGTAFESFAAAMPVGSEKAPAFAGAEGARPASDVPTARRKRDYELFYFSMMCEYMTTLASWLREDGITSPLCHNSANPNMNCYFPEICGALSGEKFLLGSDHYYTLNPGWPQNSPTPLYSVRAFYSCEQLKNLGMPPAVLEMPGGSPTDVPPILREDLYACYMINLMMGMKGVNFYVYTGGPNVPGTGTTDDIYDYHAHIHADGSKNETYGALYDFGKFCEEHAWLQSTARTSCVSVGYTWEETRSGGYDSACGGWINPSKAWSVTERGLLYALLSGGCPPEMAELTGSGALCADKPVVFMSSRSVPRAAQQKLADFVRGGGALLLMGELPELDEDFNPCRILADFVSMPEIREEVNPRSLVTAFGRHVYGFDARVFGGVPTDCAMFAENEAGHPVGLAASRGNGKVAYFAAAFEYSYFAQAEFFETVLERLGAERVLRSSNRNVLTALFECGGKRLIMAANPFSAPQSAELSVRGEHIADITLPAEGVWYKEF